MQNIRLIGAGVLAAVIATTSTCHKDKDKDKDSLNLLTLAALFPRSVVIGSATALTNAQGAAAGAAAAQPTSSTGYTFLLKQTDRMVAEARELGHRELARRTGMFIPTNYSCNGGTCSGASANSSGVTLTGSQNCTSGTITANSVLLKGSTTVTATGGTYNFTISGAGGFTFASCATSYSDYSKFPTLVSTPATINGTLVVAGTSAGTFSISGTTLTSSMTNNMRYTSSNLQVNGSSAAALDVTDTTNMNVTESNIAATVNGNLSTISFTMVSSGTYNIAGTYSGSPVQITIPLAGTRQCNFVFNNTTYAIVSGGC